MIDGMALPRGLEPLPVLPSRSAAIRIIDRLNQGFSFSITEARTVVPGLSAFTLAEKIGSVGSG